MPIDQVIAPTGPVVTYDYQPISCEQNVCPKGSYSSQASCEKDTGKKCVQTKIACQTVVCVKAPCEQPPCCNWVPTTEPLTSFTVKGVYRPVSPDQKVLDNIIDNALTRTNKNPVFRIAGNLPAPLSKAGGIDPNIRYFDVSLRTNPALPRGVVYCQESIPATPLPIQAFVGAVPQYDLEMKNCTIDYDNPVYAEIKFSDNGNMINGSPFPFIFDVKLENPTTCPPCPVCPPGMQCLDVVCPVCE
jgi:hypothetical protein